MMKKYSSYYFLLLFIVVISSFFIFKNKENFLTKEELNISLVYLRAIEKIDNQLYLIYDDANLLYVQSKNDSRIIDDSGIGQSPVNKDILIEMGFDNSGQKIVYSLLELKNWLKSESNHPVLFQINTNATGMIKKISLLE